MPNDLWKHNIIGKREIPRTEIIQRTFTPEREFRCNYLYTNDHFFSRNDLQTYNKCYVVNTVMTKFSSHIYYVVGITNIVLFHFTRYQLFPFNSKREIHVSICSKSVAMACGVSVYNTLFVDCKLKN